MTGGQKAVLIITLLASVLMGLFPPWQYTSRFHFYGNSEDLERPAGYSFIGSPPEPVRNAIGSESNPRLKYLGAGVRLDLARLAIQFVATSVVAGGLWILLKQPTRIAEREQLTAGVASASPHSTSRKAMSDGWYRIRPLSSEDSLIALAAVAIATVFHTVLSALPDPTTGGGLGAWVGTGPGCFGACLAAGWGLSAFTWLVCQKSRIMALAGFFAGCFGILVLSHSSNPKTNRFAAWGGPNLRAEQSLSALDHSIFVGPESDRVRAEQSLHSRTALEILPQTEPIVSR